MLASGGVNFSSSVLNVFTIRKCVRHPPEAAQVPLFFNHECGRCPPHKAYVIERNGIENNSYDRIAAISFHIDSLRFVLLYAGS